MDSVNERFRRTFETSEQHRQLRADADKVLAESQLSFDACNVLDEAVKGGHSAARSLAMLLYSLLGQVAREWGQHDTFAALRDIGEKLCQPKGRA